MPIHIYLIYLNVFVMVHIFIQPMLFSILQSLRTYLFILVVLFLQERI